MLPGMFSVSTIPINTAFKFQQRPAGGNSMGTHRPVHARPAVSLSHYLPRNPQGSDLALPSCFLQVLGHSGHQIRVEEDSSQDGTGRVGKIWNGSDVQSERKRGEQ